MRFESQFDLNRWAIGFEMPIMGEFPLFFSENGDIQGLEKLLGILNKTNFAVEKNILTEINDRIFYFVKKNSESNLLELVFSAENSKIKINVNSYSDSPRILNYGIDVVHNGVLFDSSLVKISFDYHECAEH